MTRISLCNLSVLCVSVVKFPQYHHRDTEDTEVAQRKPQVQINPC